MKVKKVIPTSLPKTTTYEVDPEEGDFVFAVSVGKKNHPTLAENEILCWVDGDAGCIHSEAVKKHLGI